MERPWTSKQDERLRKDLLNTTLMCALELWSEGQTPAIHLVISWLLICTLPLINVYFLHNDVECSILVGYYFLIMSDYLHTSKGSTIKFESLANMWSYLKLFFILTCLASGASHYSMIIFFSGAFCYLLLLINLREIFVMDYLGKSWAILVFRVQEALMRVCS